jgi:hypothetical protein
MTDNRYYVKNANSADFVEINGLWEQEPASISAGRGLTGRDLRRGRGPLSRTALKKCVLAAGLRQRGKRHRILFGWAFCPVASPYPM